ncbi:MAG: aspartyl protease family protein [Polaribacter sp.]|jgi:aspartyl protease family protein
MTHSTKKIGMMFTLGGWILGFLLLALGFSKILGHQSNPNQSVASSGSSQFKQITLTRNRQGHYIFDGEINQKPVTFLVDTGATITSIPAHFQNRLKLDAGAAFSVSTANGLATAYQTRLNELKMGNIILNNVKASLNPGLSDILLGMNVLKNMELIQRGNELIIRQYH